MVIELKRGDAVPEAVKAYIAQVVADVDGMVKEVSVRGKGEKVKTNKPKDKMAAYIWRWCRFHSGADMTMPVTADWDLMDAVKEKTGYKLPYSHTEEMKTEVYKKLDDFVSVVLKKMNVNDMKAALTWGKAFGMIQ